MIALLLAPALACTAPRVIDGDTLVCAGRTVRLFGVDAPELAGHPCGPSHDALGLCTPRARSWAAPARAALQTLASGAVRCTLAGNRRGAYGRTVARCRSAWSADFGATLVREGLAVDWARYSGGAYAPEQARAQAAARGLWSRP